MNPERVSKIIASTKLQLREKYLNEGIDFNLIVMGQKSSGKDLLINQLFQDQIRDTASKHRDSLEFDAQRHIAPVKAQYQKFHIKEEDAKVNLTLTSIKNTDCAIDNTSEINLSSNYSIGKMAARLDEELSIYNRNQISTCGGGFCLNRDSQIEGDENVYVGNDQRVHLVLYVIKAGQNCLKDYDLRTLEMLSVSV